MKRHVRHFLLLASVLAPACSGSEQVGDTDRELEDPETATPTRDPVADNEDAPLDMPSAFQTLSGAPALTVEQGVNVTGYTGDRVTWRDSVGRTRTAFLVGNGAQDPSGTFGGYARSFTYQPSVGVTRTVNAAAAEPGFGFIQAQRAGDYATVSNRYLAGTRTIRSVGTGHAVIEYSYPQLKTNTGATVPVKATAQWIFVAGRDAPLWSVTYDATAAGANGIELDTKAPYGALEYTGAAGTTVDGVGWGDRRKFATTSAGPVTFQSAWTYTATNVVPYVRSWNTASNAEMGLVQSQRYTQHDAGYGWFYTQWGKTSATRIIDAGSPSTQLMPANWNWTFLLNQYDLPGSSTSKKMGWGMNFGAVGKTAFPSYGYQGNKVGYPFQSYGVFLVLGAKDSTLSQVAQVERHTNAAITATRGSVVASGPAGVGRSDTATFVPAGYNHVLATWDVKAEAGTGAAVFSFNPKATAVVNPVFRIVDYPLAALPTGVRIGTTNLVQGTDYDVSKDGSTVWLTLRRTISATSTIGLNESVVPPVTWATVAIDAGTSVGGYVSDVYRWRDSSNKERSAALVRNNALDPAGFYGGYIRRFTYQKADNSTVQAVGGRDPNHPGWGYTLHHDGSQDLDRNTSSSRRTQGTYRVVFQGRHHALHEYSWTTLRTQGELPTYPPVDRAIKTTVQYLFATGRDNPVWVHTVDSSALAANAVNLDDRSPAGELSFDGIDGAVSGAGWGDRYKFLTTSAPLSIASSWDYTQTNRVPYVHMWSDGTNTEIGATQTSTRLHRDGGFGWFYNNWGRTSANKVVSAGSPATQSMPAEWNWTYQLNQWELPGNSKRIAWGTNAGAVGKTAYPVYGDDGTQVGYPYTTRSVNMVLGPKGATGLQTQETERSVDSALTALQGTVPSSGPRGIGAASTVIEAYATAGWNPTYGVFEAVAAANAARLVLDTRGGTLNNPVWRILGYTAAAPATLAISINGGAAQTLVADQDYFASVVTMGAQSELWLTLKRSLVGSVELGVNAQVGGGTGTGLSPTYQHFDINHVLSTGQSNSVANSGTPVLSTTQPYANLMFNVGVMTASGCNGDGCTGYQTPGSLVPLVEGDMFFNYNVETMSSGLANQITKRSREVYLVGQPVGRTSHDLLVSLHGRSGNSYYCLRMGGCPWLSASYIKPFTDGMNQVRDAKALAAAAGKTYVVRGVTTIHGETDHYSPGFPIAGTDGTPNKITNYSDALLEWQADYETQVKAQTGQALGVPLYLAQMSSWTNTAASAVANLQLDAHTRAPGKVVLVTPGYPLAFAGDCIHYTSHSNRRLGEYFAKAYLAQVLEGRAWEPLRPLSVVRNGAILTVKFKVPVPPLVLDTTQVTNPGNFGFRYTDGSGAAPAISSVVVSAPDTVTITLASTPVGTNRRLTYAQNAPAPNACPGPTQGARGNLRDSDATPSQYGYALQNWAVHFDVVVP